MACQEPGMIGKVASVGAEISPSYAQLVLPIRSSVIGSWKTCLWWRRLLGVLEETIASQFCAKLDCKKPNHYRHCNLTSAMYPSIVAVIIPLLAASAQASKVDGPCTGSYSYGICETIDTCNYYGGTHTAGYCPDTPTDGKDHLL